MPETPLELATRHVSAGRGIVENQKALLAELRRDGHSTIMAEDLLKTYEASLAAFERDLAELSQPGSADQQR